MMQSEEKWIEKIIRRGIKQNKSNLKILEELDESEVEYDVEEVTSKLREWREFYEKAGVI